MTSQPGNELMPQETLSRLLESIERLTDAIEENTRVRELGEIEYVDSRTIAAILHCHHSNVRHYHEGGKKESGWMEGIHHIRRDVDKGLWMYNRPLIQDWLRNRYDRASHLRALAVWEKSKMGNRGRRKR